MMQEWKKLPICDAKSTKWNSDSEFSVISSQFSDFYFTTIKDNNCCCILCPYTKPFGALGELVAEGVVVA